MSEPQPNPTVGGNPEADRRAKLVRLREELGVEPYGGRTEGLITLAEARAQYDPAADAAAKAAGADPANDQRPLVRVAGRIVLHRDIGKLVFMTLRDDTDDLQVGVSKQSVDEQSLKLAKLADLGDIVVVSGRIGSTKTGEKTVWAQEPSPPGRGQGEGEASADLQHVEKPSTTAPSPQPSPGGRGGQSAFAIACKSLAPPPEKWHGLTDPELRYRKRYVDLYANPKVMQLAKRRAQIIEEIRQYLRGRGFLEVETPMMQPLAGGATAKPFVTHHNALDIQLYLRIAPELYLKRLLVGGFRKVFEINRNFRNEGISPRHNPEFTMLEAYEAFGSWETMADMVEDMICTVAEKVLGTLTIEHKDDTGAVTRTINLARPWRRVRMVDLVAEWLGKAFGLQWSFTKQGLQRGNQADDHLALALGMHMKKEGEYRTGGLGTPRPEAVAGIAVHFAYERLEKMTPAEQLVELYEKLIEPTLIDPTFVTHVPSVVIPLARENACDPFFADVYELAINGVEISPGYSELNDPDVQEKHLRHQVGDPRKDEQQPIDEDFLEALRVGMPPAGGMGLGIDRLIMMLTGAQSIRDVILFPLMRPRGANDEGRNSNDE